jgi:hypothetical protein
VSFFSYLQTTNFAEKHSRWMDLIITAAASWAALLQKTLLAYVHVGCW